MLLFHLACSKSRLVDSESGSCVGVDHHVFTRTAASELVLLKKLYKCIGLVQSGYHYHHHHLIKMLIVLTMILLKNCSISHSLENQLISFYIMTSELSFRKDVITMVIFFHWWQSLPQIDVDPSWPPGHWVTVLYLFDCCWCYQRS